jgi:hypothetical protein
VGDSNQNDTDPEEGSTDNRMVLHTCTHKPGSVKLHENHEFMEARKSPDCGTYVSGSRFGFVHTLPSVLSSGNPADDDT